MPISPPGANQGVYPMRPAGFAEERYPSQSERQFFSRSPQVAGYAAEDDRVVLNPAILSEIIRSSIRANESSRLLQRGGYVPPPQFDLTPAQRKRFGQYGTDEDQKATIAARAASGDPSGGEYTQEQLAYVAKILAPLLALMPGAQ